MAGARGDPRRQDSAWAERMPMRRRSRETIRTARPASLGERLQRPPPLSLPVPLRCSRKLDPTSTLRRSRPRSSRPRRWPRSRAWRPRARGRSHCAATEIVVDPPSLPARGPLGSGNQVNLDVTVRNVSRRRLEIAVDPAVAGSGARLQILPDTLALDPASPLRSGCSVACGRCRPRRRPVRRHPDRARVRCSVPCALGDRGACRRQAVAHTAASLADHVRTIRRQPGRPQRRRWSRRRHGSRPAAFCRSRSFRIDLLPRRPAARDDCTRPRPLPGLYAFGLTVAGPAASHFPAGSIRWRLEATPVSGAADTETIHFHIR